jgi:hypothetical protein
VIAQGEIPQKVMAGIIGGNTYGGASQADGYIREVFLCLFVQHMAKNMGVGLYG